MPTLADIGEDELIHRLVRNLPQGRGVLVGPGDDCAVVEAVPGGGHLLLKADAVVEGVHFTRDAPPRNYRESVACDRDMALAFHSALQEEGVRVNQQAKWFLSAAHDDAVIDETLAAAERAMAKLA